jgi:hypothetical protein
MKERQWDVVVLFRVCEFFSVGVCKAPGVDWRSLNATTIVDRCYPSSTLPCLLRFVLEPITVLGLRHSPPVGRFWYQRLLYLGVEPGVLKEVSSMKKFMIFFLIYISYRDPILVPTSVTTRSSVLVPFLVPFSMAAWKEHDFSDFIQDGFMSVFSANFFVWLKCPRSLGFAPTSTLQTH